MLYFSGLFVALGRRRRPLNAGSPKPLQTNVVSLLDSDSEPEMDFTTSKPPKAAQSKPQPDLSSPSFDFQSSSSSSENLNRPNGSPHESSGSSSSAGYKPFSRSSLRSSDPPGAPSSFPWSVSSSISSASSGSSVSSTSSSSALRSRPSDSPKHGLNERGAVTHVKSELNGSPVSASRSANNQSSNNSHGSSSSDSDKLRRALAESAARRRRQAPSNASDKQPQNKRQKTSVGLDSSSSSNSRFNGLPSLPTSPKSSNTGAGKSGSYASLSSAPASSSSSYSGLRSHVHSLGPSPAVLDLVAQFPWKHSTCGDLSQSSAVNELLSSLDTSLLVPATRPSAVFASSSGRALGHPSSSSSNSVSSSSSAVVSSSSSITPSYSTSSSSASLSSAISSSMSSLVSSSVSSSVPAASSSSSYSSRLDDFLDQLDADMVAPPLEVPEPSLAVSSSISSSSSSRSSKSPRPKRTKKLPARLRDSDLVSHASSPLDPLSLSESQEPESQNSLYSDMDDMDNFSQSSQVSDRKRRQLEKRQQKKREAEEKKRIREAAKKVRDAEKANKKQAQAELMFWKRQATGTYKERELVLRVHPTVFEGEGAHLREALKLSPFKYEVERLPSHARVAADHGDTVSTADVTDVKGLIQFIWLRYLEPSPESTMVPCSDPPSKRKPNYNVIFLSARDALNTFLSDVQDIREMHLMVAETATQRAADGRGQFTLLIQGLPAYLRANGRKASHGSSIKTMQDAKDRLANMCIEPVRWNMKYVLTDTAGKSAEYLVMATSALCKTPSKVFDDPIAFTNAARGIPGENAQKTSFVNFLKEIGVPETKARAASAKYPTFLTLKKAYEGLPREHGELLLADLRVGQRAFGPIHSRKIYEQIHLFHKGDEKHESPHMK